MFAIEGIVVDDDITYWTKIFKKKQENFLCLTVFLWSFGDQLICKQKMRIFLI